LSPGTILIFLNPQYKKENKSRYLIKLSGTGAAIRICGSAEPEPKEIFQLHNTVNNFTVLQHIDTVDASKAASEGSVTQPVMMDLDLTCLKKKKTTSEI
jgi:hypothetical protein